MTSGSFDDDEDDNASSTPSSDYEDAATGTVEAARRAALAGAPLGDVKSTDSPAPEKSAESSGSGSGGGGGAVAAAAAVTAVAAAKPVEVRGWKGDAYKIFLSIFSCVVCGRREACFYGAVMAEDGRFCFAFVLLKGFLRSVHKVGS